MSTNARVLVTAAVAAAMVALPATGVAKPGKHQRCKKAPTVGYSVTGSLLTFTADDPATSANERQITLTVTGANNHARKSGAAISATFTVPAGDPGYRVELKGFAGADTPSPGDTIKVSGRITRTKKSCAPPGTSTADLYGTPDVRRVTVTDRDADT
ncbi:MAG TPA: hypothetical protein VFZ89_08130 [Solirubrobacteraceae bacterium]